MSILSLVKVVNQTKVSLQGTEFETSLLDTHDIRQHNRCILVCNCLARESIFQTELIHYVSVINE